MSAFFDSVTSWDLSVLDYIRANFTCKFFDVVSVVMALLADHGIFCIVLAAVLIAIPKTRKTGLCLGIAFAFGGFFGNLIIKNLVGRVRPYEISGVDIIVKRLTDYSFPSGHTLFAFEAAGVTFIREKKSIFAITLLLAFAMALSRLYLYVHYPTDVIVAVVMGFAFGIIGGILGVKLYDSLARKFRKDRI